MADTVKKTKATAKATATPRQVSANNVKVAEVEKPTTPPKTATKKESVVAISQPKVVSREMIEKVAYQIWVQRGYQHGYALEDWIAAERELLERAS